MRNKCSQAIRKAKVSYFKEQFSLCGSNLKKFWKIVKDLENKPSFSQLPMSLNVDDPRCSSLFLPLAPLQNFSLQAVTESEVLKELLKLDPKTTSGSDGLDPVFFKVAAPIIAKPVSDLFNLSLLSGEVPSALEGSRCVLYLKGEVKLILTVI
ncbi:unnamed protein product, partial [Coregonus sp. 'balchen']